MKNFASFTRSCALASVVALAAAGFGAAPASAAAGSAPCQVNHEEQPVGGWSMFTTFRSKGVTCRQAKAVMTTCSSSKTVPGWKVSRTESSGFRFTNRKNSSRRFAVMVAGGTPPCLAKLALG